MAGIIFNDFGTSNNYQSNFGWTVSGADSSVKQFIQANEFTAALSGSVTEVDLGISISSGTGNGTLSLWTVGKRGLPATQLGPFWSFTAHQAFGNCCAVEVIHTPDAPHLSAGTSYFIILKSDAITVDEWNLNSTGAVGIDLFSRDDMRSWTSNGTTTLGAFRVITAVPEPSTLVLLVACILPIVGALMRK
jgi:hypothetical protein